MFNFIFDGKIGEMLAPVVPSNQLFLAIQHHKNDEIPALMLSMDFNNSQKLSEGGYSAIHVACRYNNRYALELLLSKGVSIELPDNQGNTPLHFAAKYGHVELCKVLLERGSSLTRRNKQNQNAYDASDSHIVRQYLLPLVFQAERTQPADQMQQQTAAFQQQSNSMPPSMNNSDFAMPAPPPPAMSLPGMTNPFQTKQQGLPTASTGAYSSPAQPAPFAAQGIVPPVYRPQQQQGPPQLIGTYNNANSLAKPAGTSRTFQPDGFHSSASDPELQRKYGHTNIVTNIAPPPTDIAFGSSSVFNNGNTASPPTFAPPSSGSNPPLQQSIYSRYVPYDAHTNSAGPIPSPLVMQQPPSLLSPGVAPGGVNVMAPSPTLAAGGGGGSQKLLGNKTLPIHAEGSVAAPQQQPIVTSTSAVFANSGRGSTGGPMVHVFNPSTDCSVIDASSASGSVL